MLSASCYKVGLFCGLTSLFDLSVSSTTFSGVYILGRPLDGLIQDVRNSLTPSHSNLRRTCTTCAVITRLEVGHAAMSKIDLVNDSSPYIISNRHSLRSFILFLGECSYPPSVLTVILQPTFSPTACFLFH